MNRFNTFFHEEGACEDAERIFLGSNRALK
jgi:hypothetical protein